MGGQARPHRSPAGPRPHQRTRSWRPQPWTEPGSPGTARAGTGRPPPGSADTHDAAAAAATGQACAKPGRRCQPAMRRRIRDGSPHRPSPGPTARTRIASTADPGRRSASTAGPAAARPASAAGPCNPGPCWLSSGIHGVTHPLQPGLHTPADVRYGTAGAIRDKRVSVLASAYAAHPERFVRKPPEPPKLPADYLSP